jgi:hypothetical protein
MVSGARADQGTGSRESPTHKEYGSNEGIKIVTLRLLSQFQRPVYSPSSKLKRSGAISGTAGETAESYIGKRTKRAVCSTQGSGFQ